MSARVIDGLLAEVFEKDWEKQEDWEKRAMPGGFTRSDPFAPQGGMGGPSSMGGGVQGRAMRRLQARRAGLPHQPTGGYGGMGGSPGSRPPASIPRGPRWP